MLKQQRITSDALFIISESYKELIKEMASLSILMIILTQISMWDAGLEYKPIKKGGRKRKQAFSVGAQKNLQEITLDNAPSASNDLLSSIVSSFTKDYWLSLLSPQKLKRAALLIIEKTLDNNKEAASQL